MRRNSPPIKYLLLVYPSGQLWAYDSTIIRDDIKQARGGVGITPQTIRQECRSGFGISFLIKAEQRGSKLKPEQKKKSSPWHACKKKRIFWFGFFYIFFYQWCPRRHSPPIKCVWGPGGTERTSQLCSFVRTTGAGPQIRKTSWRGHGNMNIMMKKIANGKLCYDDAARWPSGHSCLHAHTR